VRIPVGSAHLNLVGKALCRRHRNKLIVNAAKRQKTAEQKCLHPNHREYLVSASKDTKLIKPSICLIEFFNLPSDAMICNHCRYISERDEMPQNCLHQETRPKITPEDKIVNIQNRTYALRSDILYTAEQLE